MRTQVTEFTEKIRLPPGHGTGLDLFPGMKDSLVAIWRSAVRERSHALINLAGLAVGFACSLVLGLFLYGEMTYDRHFAGHEHVYRMVDHFTAGDTRNHRLWISRAIPPLLAREYPQIIEAYTRFTDASLQDGLRLRHGDLVLSWRQTYFADPDVFKVLPHQVIAGDPATALAAGHSVAVSQKLARAYFGDGEALGKLLYTDAGEAWQITLVFADLPPNTHLRYDALFAASIPLLRDADTVSGLREQVTTGYGALTYLRMRPGFDPAGWPALAEDFYRHYLADVMPPGVSSRLWLQPLAQTHYQPDIFDDQPVSNPTYLYGCLTVALLILAVACINYINLATARALRRARSVAFRKILGARRGRLLLECLGEAVLYALAAAVLGMALAEVAITLTPIGELLGNQVRFDLSADPALAGIVFGAAVLVGLIAGAWPAFYLSSRMPAAAFSARGGGTVASGARVREALVLLQFVIAVGVVAATLVMASQMRFIATTPLGFQRENQVLVTIRGTHNFDRVPVLKRELMQHPEVLTVAQTLEPPGHFGGTVVSGTNQDGKASSLQFYGTRVDADFIPALGIELVAGSNFSEEPQGGTQLIINEPMARLLDLEGDPVGQDFLGARITGVVRDFHFHTLHTPIGPMVLALLTNDYSSEPPARHPFLQRTLVIRISGRDFEGTMRHIEEVMRRFDPANPFEYRLLDQTLGELYQTEQRMLALIATFAALCILIACLGLYGLTAFATERRAREIAIRKVLGASSWHVVMLLGRRVLLMIVVGGAIAAALAWLVMREWLAGFAYRVDVNPALLAVAVVLAALVALVTMMLQSMRAARADPAAALRGE
jgi:putative ABC transport system permease protein